MYKKKYNLVVCAHPDDETIFFGDLILSQSKIPWKIICATDANADGMGAERKIQFQDACRMLRVKDYAWLGFPDIYEKRLDVKALTAQLKDLPTPAKIFTHGILGEYGHPHHQDVSLATHEAFRKHPNVYSSGWNCFPDVIIKTTKQNYDRKGKILSEIYGSETRRFFNLLPSNGVQTLVKVKYQEVRAIYDFLTGNAALDVSKLSKYRWLKKHLQERGPNIPPRLF